MTATIIVRLVLASLRHAWEWASCSDQYCEAAESGADTETLAWLVAQRDSASRDAARDANRWHAILRWQASAIGSWRHMAIQELTGQM